MEVKIGTKVRNRSVHEHKKQESSPPNVKVQTKKIGKTTKPKSKIKPRVIPFPIEEDGNGLIDWASPGNPFAKEKRDKRPLVHLFISVAGALLVGTVMGFSVLTLFFSEHPNANNHTIDAHLPTDKKPAESKPVTQKPAEVKPTTMNLPQLKVSLLQAGNYQSKTSATKVAEQYRTKGFAAVMSDQAPFRIYLGVAGSKQEAQMLAKRYAAKGITVYVKEQTFDGRSEKLAGLLDTLKIGNRLFGQLQTMSVVSITKSQKMKIAAEWNVQQQAFMKANQKSNAYPADSRAAMMELARGLDQAVQGATELSKHQNSTFAWFVQEGLVRYATGYEHLIYSLTRNK